MVLTAMAGQKAIWASHQRELPRVAWPDVCGPRHKYKTGKPDNKFITKNVKFNAHFYLKTN